MGDIAHLTAYPERPHLATVVDPVAYAGRAFTLRMALGEAQLTPAFFDLVVLETYRNDPRYFYETNDLSGFISVTDEHYETGTMRGADQVLLESFGFAYDKDFRRGVCVFTRYLSRLTPEHQQVWSARELPPGYAMHPAYYQSSVLGEFPERESIFVAMLEELTQMKRMSEVLGLPPLVRDDFKGSKPHNLGFLIRPTLKELQDFHATLDKLMSENLNKKFLAEFVPELEAEREREDGKIVVTPKGTILLLEEWMNEIEFQDRAPVDQMLATFREVRKLRQRPAHASDDNTFDLRYYEEQRDLVIRAYRALRILREALSNHPKLRGYDGVPDWLEKAEIYAY